VLRGHISSFPDRAAKAYRSGHNTLTGVSQAGAIDFGAMFYLRYVRRELVRRRARTILTVLGLAPGVGLVIVISVASRRGTTVVVATHDAKLAARAPRRISMRDGRISDEVAVEPEPSQTTG